VTGIGGAKLSGGYCIGYRGKDGEEVGVDMSCGFGERVRIGKRIDVGIDVGILLLTSGIVIDIISPVAELHVGVVVFKST
jgi:hypothetical protein